MKREVKYTNYLNDLRQSGACNMWGTTVWLERDFPELNHEKAREVLGNWVRKK